MEELNFKVEKINYVAVYDPTTHQIIKVGPSTAFLNEDCILSLEENLALQIIEGSIRLSNCFVDLNSKTLELVEKQHLIKIDDVLHRIIEKKWSKNKLFEIYISYYKKSNSLKIEMTSEYSGTRKVKNTQSRKLNWSGDTTMDFYITDYNDPHNLQKKISFSINDLIKKSVIINNICLPSTFSIYTRRIFKEYVLDIK